MELEQATKVFPRSGHSPGLPLPVSPLVLGQGRALAEALPTFTFVGLLPSVDPLVGNQVAALGETLSTF